jgi:protein involved in polysaccharide export with SLBB domain
MTNKCFGPTLWMFFALLLAGCTTPQHFSELPDPGYNQDTLRAGDALSITLSDIPNAEARPPIEPKVSVDGKITIIHNQTFEADGKTCAELANEIHDRLVPLYYHNLTVNVRSVGQVFYVDGEVKNPSRQPWLVALTVTQAIAASGGFTDFANKGKVELIRVNGRRQTIDCNKCLINPALDPKVYPGDKVHVRRKIV